ncbi:dUTP diphosphatase [Blattabacterium cuenoti]|uniref:dUTP diphosphatase n=1 Tax=Blattabacterium cuenoti BPAY TaxID=1457031 RepID=A0ABM7EXS9_9FLAO|nr:dUTP diphosphatase [Blattabacterium cuenoti]BAR91795.1 dUTP diphosphatase [Blattabacterium cuenoti BPAY]
MRRKIYRYTLVASIKRPVEINFLKRKLISTGLFIYENTRYSFFLKKKMIESICVIHLTKKKKHPFYMEIQIIVINVSPKKKIIIYPNEELGVLDIVTNVKKIKWKESSILNISMRGNNSFGSTGIL